MSGRHEWEVGERMEQSEVDGVWRANSQLIENRRAPHLNRILGRRGGVEGGREKAR